MTVKYTLADGRKHEKEFHPNDRHVRSINKKQDWTCNRCNFSNLVSDDICIMCATNCGIRRNSAGEKQTENLYQQLLDYETSDMLKELYGFDSEQVRRALELNTTRDVRLLADWIITQSKPPNTEELPPLVWV